MTEISTFRKFRETVWGVRGAGSVVGRGVSVWAARTVLLFPADRNRKRMKKARSRWIVVFGRERLKKKGIWKSFLTGFDTGMFEVRRFVPD
jgi:hypothetical protein